MKIIRILFNDGGILLVDNIAWIEKRSGSICFADRLENFYSFHQHLIREFKVLRYQP